MYEGNILKTTQIYQESKNLKNLYFLVNIFQFCFLTLARHNRFDGAREEEQERKRRSQWNRAFKAFVQRVRFFFILSGMKTSGSGDIPYSVIIAKGEESGGIEF